MSQNHNKLTACGHFGHIKTNLQGQQYEQTKETSALEHKDNTSFQ